MKPLFILINQRDGSGRVAINANDLRVLTVKSNRATVQTSVCTFEFSCSDYMMTRIKRELSERYNLVEISNTDLRITGSRDNALLMIRDSADSSLTVIWPRAVQSLAAVSGGLRVDISAHGSKPVTIKCNPVLNDKVLKEKLSAVGLVSVSLPEN